MKNLKLFILLLSAAGAAGVAIETKAYADKTAETKKKKKKPAKKAVKFHTPASHEGEHEVD